MFLRFPNTKFLPLFFFAPLTLKKDFVHEVSSSFTISVLISEMSS
jgi:hypothetical protein